MTQNDPSASSGAAISAESPHGETPALDRCICDFESFDYDADDGAYRVLYDPEDVAPSTAVISAVAALTDTDPLDIEPLHSAIDPDALDTIATDQPAEGDLKVTFNLDSHAVTVKSSGSLQIRSALSE